MTRDEILSMGADRELDALVANTVFNEPKWCPEDPDDVLCRCDLTKPGTIHVRQSLPHFSTDIAAAWEVVEKMREDGWMPNLVFHRSDGLWRCEYFTDRRMRNAAHRSAFVSICHAALLTVREEE